MTKTARKKDHLVHMLYEFPAGCRDAEGAQLASIVVRELDTEDAKDAAKAADFNKTDWLDEMIGISVVAVNGYALAGPLDMTGWTVKAKDWVMRCYMQLNTIQDASNLGKGQAVNPTTMRPVPPVEPAE